MGRLSRCSLGFGTQPCYKAPSNPEVAVSEVVPFEIAQSSLWGSQMADKNVLLGKNISVVTWPKRGLPDFKGWNVTLDETVVTSQGLWNKISNLKYEIKLN